MSDAPSAGESNRAGVSARSWGRRDTATEATYLALLSRDVGHTRVDLREAAALERSQELNGLTAYRAFGSSRTGPEPDSVRTALTELMVRRTPTLSKSAPDSAAGVAEGRFDRSPS